MLNILFVIIAEDSKIYNCNERPWLPAKKWPLYVSQNKRALFYICLFACHV